MSLPDNTRFRGAPRKNSAATSARILITALAVLLIPGGAGAQKSEKFDEAGLAVNWELLGHKPKPSAAFTINNRSETRFPARGWELYFNSSLDISSSPVTGGVKIEQVNGDIYRLSPDENFAGLGPGDSNTVTYRFEGRLLNYSVAPSGMYLVWDSQPLTGRPLANFSLTPIKDPAIDFITPGDIYARNRVIKDIPASQLPKIFPTPREYRELQGEFILTPEAAIVADPSFELEAQYLAEETGTLLGKPLRLVRADDSGGSIFLKTSAMDEEAYELTVLPEKIEITASGPAGIFYGIQSLRSLLPPASWAGARRSISIPAARAKDAPRFGFRSLLLDVARNFKSKEQVFKTLDLMALYKLNVLHFHMIDDEGWRLEIPGLPELTEIGSRRGHPPDDKKFLPPSFGAGPEPGRTLASGHYTRADFIGILKYAARRHIKVIPEIESPGHSRAAIKAMDARYDRLLRLGKKREAEHYLLRDLKDGSTYRTPQSWTDNVMCVALPGTYRFLEKVIDEIQLMYKEAGAPLDTIHLGGDEVPAGAWERSPASQKLIAEDPDLKTTDDLWYYYFRKVNAMLKKRGLFLSGWEEIGLRKTALDGKKQLIPNPDFVNENFLLHVWNNMIGWGAEDLPYRLANAGYKVVLSCVSNNYFDLAYSRSPDEPGYYWGGFQDIDKPFYFVPYDYYRTTKEDARGDPADPAYFQGKDRLTDYGKSNIAGIQGLLWGENLATDGSLEYMLLPKLLGLAERAWAKDPQWAVEKDQKTADELYEQAWSGFVNVVGKRELPRLDNYHGGFNYRIPPVGAILTDGKISANIQLPGFELRYTADGTEPSAQSVKYTGPVADKGTIKLRAFNTRGRGGRVTTLENP